MLYFLPALHPWDVWSCPDKTRQAGHWPGFRQGCPLPCAPKLTSGPSAPLTQLPHGLGHVNCASQGGTSGAVNACPKATRCARRDMSGLVTLLKIMAVLWLVGFIDMKQEKSTHIYLAFLCAHRSLQEENEDPSSSSTVLWKDRLWDVSRKFSGGTCGGSGLFHKMVCPCL